MADAVEAVKETAQKAEAKVKTAAKKATAKRKPAAKKAAAKRKPAAKKKAAPARKKAAAKDDFASRAQEAGREAFLASINIHATWACSVRKEQQSAFVRQMHFYNHFYSDSYA